MKASRIVFSLVIVAIIALITLSLARQKNHQSSMKDIPSPNQADTYIINGQLSSFNEKGLLKSQLTSEKITHYPGKQAAILIKPQMIIYTDNRVRWYISADNANTLDNNKKIILSGHVVIYRPQQNQAEQTKITTSELTYYPEQSYADTDRDANIVSSDTTLTSKGMSIDIKNGVLTTKSQTRGVYEPSSR